ncbi:hypothetical protein EVAR_19509_1 [Eumeta japonica]|uniref:Uncharacterized protein n=1 Tax=Eumeta variegata TaxID=151549 RepID=A0A4C1V8R7_EUMVA|nr:hypothetical protein EVAR_19509_1 [Eumeta japonica]
MNDAYGRMPNAEMVMTVFPVRNDEDGRETACFSRLRTPLLNVAPKGGFPKRRVGANDGGGHLNSRRRSGARDSAQAISGAGGRDTPALHQILVSRCSLPRPLALLWPILEKLYIS